MQPIRLCSSEKVAPICMIARRMSVHIFILFAVTGIRCAETMFVEARSEYFWLNEFLGQAYIFGEKEDCGVNA